MREILISAIVTALVFIAAAPDHVQAAQIVDGIAAVVNGEVITIGDLDAQIDERLKQTGIPEGYTEEQVHEQGRRLMLESMINDILIQQEAERLGLEVSQADLENAIRKIREGNGLTVEQFRSQIALKNMTREEYAESVRKQLLKQRLIGYMVQHRVVVTDKELAEYASMMKQHSMPMGMGPMDMMMEAPAPDASAASEPSSMVELSIIIVGTQDEAEDLHNAVSSGKLSFADAAKQHSQGPGASEGGSLGTIALSELGAPIQQAVSKTSPGKVSDVFGLADQYAFIQLKSKQGPAQAAPQKEPEPEPEDNETATASAGPSPESVLSSLSQDEIDQLRNRLMQQKLEERFSDYMKQLRDKAVIRVNL
ncbi:SurA N-terminal domain-containing protein [Oceanidesulfovibrio marinus]|uniref:PpiC domain-containing protein n=1 Tax=Oceanidesulfovibrio marinus TaxID=370038 RepID=A0A6P1ZII6_9BACT|nr:SurA N-terminal domain-containing protein [Oceanidesulfovibrio marinus]QJT08189.1 hypothetical protein E8L03_04285 [Oceanidesulfovibrio marinus]TVM35084.1 hypothetical protein DQK91_06705 [Oceanidesulfovibrio marinus]